MPKSYEAVRDNCIKRKKKNKGKITEKDRKDCQRMAAIWYWKTFHKPVKHSDAENIPLISDAIDLDIMNEQLDFFGTLKKYDDWNLENRE